MHYYLFRVARPAYRIPDSQRLMLPGVSIHTLLLKALFYMPTLLLVRSVMSRVAISFCSIQYTPSVLMKRRKLRTQLLDCSRHVRIWHQKNTLCLDGPLKAMEGGRREGDGMNRGMRWRYRLNEREGGNWQTGCCLLLWKQASYPHGFVQMCVSCNMWVCEQRPSDDNVPSAH